jgi:chromosomal replication initiator protein
MDTQAIWQAALGEIELTLTKANFITWFKNTFVVSFDNGKVIVAVPNAFTKTWLEKKYHEAIVKSLRSATNQSVREVTYRVEARNTTVIPLDTFPEEMLQEFGQTIPSLACDAMADAHSCDIGLNPRYLFQHFIVGKGNELAHAAAMAVAGKPGTTYNPLFIYGGVGMGKTHLLQAVGHHILLQQPEAKVLYVTCERFTNEYIQSVRTGHANDFKNIYRTVDVLLVDDIQFLTGKEGTQEEFFHTFNTLHQNNKQIVIAADRAPKDIQSLEGRLLSRFEWGMVTDISKPDFETRVAILQSKSKEKQYPLSLEILHAIAGAIQSNIRELEGALNKIVAYHQFKNLLPSLESVQTLLQSFAPAMAKRAVTPRSLVDVIVHYYEISMEDILGKSREQRFALPRQVAMYLLREETKCSYPAIGHQIGNRDHTTAMHACEKIGSLVKNNDQIKKDLSSIRERLYTGSAQAS